MRPRLLDLFCGAGGCSVGYDRAGFDLRLDYTRPPDPELAPEDAAWADELLRRAGLR